MKTGVLLLNFGEPETASHDEVARFLERIFLANSALDGAWAREHAFDRARALAEARAPDLVEEYRAIGGSPLKRQAEEQARLLAGELLHRGHDVKVLVGMQFTSPSIDEAVASARGSGVGALVGVPLYPIPGPSTTDAALADLRDALWKQGWTGPVFETPIWYRHPEYVRLRAGGVRAVAERAGVDLESPGTVLLCSAHGTPLRYIRQGSPYVRHVREFCRALTAELREPRSRIGFQNHDNRPGVRWTEPGVEEVIRDLAEDPSVLRVVVEPVSFAHEQSETLVELDRELRALAEDGGLGYHRVPVPYDAAPFIQLLADRVEPLLRPEGRCGAALRNNGTGTGWS